MKRTLTNGTWIALAICMMNRYQVVVSFVTKVGWPDIVIGTYKNKETARRRASSYFHKDCMQTKYYRSLAPEAYVIDCKTGTKLYLIDTAVIVPSVGELGYY